MPYYISPRTWSDCVFTDLLAIDNITKMEDLEHKCSCRGGAPEDGLSPALSASAPGGWLLSAGVSRLADYQREGRGHGLNSCSFEIFK